MRFSLLTLNLETWRGSGQTATLDRIARYAAQENLTCICLQGCEQQSTSAFVEESEALRVDNAGYLIQSRLGAYGLKYSMVWGYAHDDRAGLETGSAILTQLPILGTCSKYVSEHDDPEDEASRNVVMVRLAVAPNAVIDAYSVHLGPAEAGLERQLGALTRFVEETPDMLEQLKPPPPKRRGPPRKRVPVEEPPVSTRLICIAGDMNEEPGGLVKSLTGGGFLEASATAREASPETGTRTDGRWTDYVYVKPALRPQAARVVLSGPDSPPVSDHYGVVVEFEV